MSRTRQPISAAPTPDCRASSVVYSARFTWRRRANPWNELVSVSRGTLLARSEDGVWTVAADQALWVPAGTRLQLDLGAAMALRMVHLHPRIKVRLPKECRLIGLTPLLREVLRRAHEMKTLARSVERERALLEVLQHELEALPAGPFSLRIPNDPRGARAAALVRDSPDSTHPLRRLAKEAFASPRTLERIFRRETGLPFGAWCRRARLLRSLEVLGDGTSVTRAAQAAGYQSTSAFVAAFRRDLGVTPGRYFARGGSE